MKELNHSLKISPQAEDPSPEFSLREVSLQFLPGTRLYSQQDGGAIGLEQLRALQIHLMDLQREKPFKKVLITSAVCGEGKTHVAANLSLSLAAEGLGRILVIDTDVRNPSLHLVFGIPNLFGFKDCIANENNHWIAVQKVKDFELYVVTGGVGSCSSIGPARIAAVQMLLEQLEPIFDLIILDSPPILGGVDSKLLSGVADSILVVVGSGKASRRLVMQAQQSLQKDKILGVVLNRLDPAMACFSSYSGYDSTHTARGNSNTGGRGKDSPAARGKDREPEPETRREPTIIPIGLHEEAIPEPQEAVTASHDVSSVGGEPKIATAERHHDPVMAASPSRPTMRDLITGVFKLGPQLPPPNKTAERGNTKLPAQETAPLPPKTRWWAQDYTTTALLVAIVTLAGIVGWALGQGGARYLGRQTAPEQQTTPTQSAAPVASEAVASASPPSTALTDPSPLALQTPVSDAPVRKSEKPTPGGLVLYDDGRVVMRADRQSKDSSSGASNTDAKSGQP